jgi:predicted transglutaminase-like cysteine proteinase
MDRRTTPTWALALAGFAFIASPAAGQDDRPIAAGEKVSAEHCAPIHRTSPEFLAAFAGIGDATVPDDPLGAAFPPLVAPTNDKASPTRILASAMLPAGHTGFDAEWRRVRDTGVDEGCAVLLLGGVPRTPGEALDAVNRWVNRNVRYVEESTDAWAEAPATLRKRRGDCEDMAILKLQLLTALGVRAEDLYLTLVRDLARNADHAVLVVRANGALWILDSATDGLLDARERHDYRPILSYSADRKWLHGN